MSAARCTPVRLALIVLAPLLLAIASTSAQSIVRIGVIDRMDGSIARGAQLAAKHINEGGGLLDANGARAELVIAVTSPDFMEIATANMRQADVIAVLGPSSPEAFRAALPQLQDLEVPVFTTISSDALLLQDSSGHVFRSVARESLQNRALAAYLAQSQGYSQITTIQLDAASTSSLIGFASALSEAGLGLSNLLYDESSKDLVAITQQIAARPPEALVLYGPPLLAAQAYLRLRADGYTGRVGYSHAMDPDFASLVPSDSLAGIIGAASWSFTLDEASNQQFLWDYASSYGALPDSINAASYDAVGLLAQAYRQPGELADSIAALERYEGLQGPLEPAQLPRGETSANVVITENNEFGASNAIATYRGAALSATGRGSGAATIPKPTALPLPTAAGYQLTILSQSQNVRSGPDLSFDVIGQLPGGTQAEVIGATEDFAWLLIDFRGQWGWLAAYLVDAAGNPDQVPIILPPPSATPEDSAGLGSSS